MPSESVKRKMTNARFNNLSPHQLRMLHKAAAWEDGMTPIKWFTMRTARALERRGLGEVRNMFEWEGGWAMIGWCFVINEDGRRAAGTILEA